MEIIVFSDTYMFQIQKSVNILGFRVEKLHIFHFFVFVTYNYIVHYIWTNLIAVTTTHCFVAVEQCMQILNDNNYFILSARAFYRRVYCVRVTPLPRRRIPFDKLHNNTFYAITQLIDICKIWKGTPVWLMYTRVCGLQLNKSFTNCQQISIFQNNIYLYLYSSSINKKDNILIITSRTFITLKFV